MLDIFRNYMGTGLIVIWFLIALIYLFFHEKRVYMRIMFIYSPVIILLLFFNPLFYKFFYLMVGEEIYFRICWLLPITAVIAYALVMVCDTLQGKRKVCFAITAALILAVSGKSVYSSPLFSKAENMYHVPQEVADICDAIEIEGREVMAAFPEEHLLYVRQYSPTICMPYGRNVSLGEHHHLFEEINRDTINVEVLVKFAKSAGCHYLIISQDKAFIGNLTDYNYEIFASMHDYVIYRDTTMYFGL